MSGDRPTLTPGESFGEGYRILRLIGAGGVGDVYRVHPIGHEPSGCPLALKVYSRLFADSAEAIARFQSELPATVALDLRHLLRVLEVAVEPRTGLPFVVTALLVVAFAACGADGSGTSSTATEATAPLSKSGLPAADTTLSTRVRRLSLRRPT